MSTSNNVIIFPNSPVKDMIQSIEDVNERMELIHSYHVEEAIETIAHILFGNLGLAGFDLCSDEDNEEEFKDRVFILESIKSVLYKQYGIYHPFQQIEQNVFENVEDGFIIANHLNLKNLTKEDEEETNNVISETN